MKTLFSLLIVCGLLAMSTFAGTQTENYGIPVLPAPGKVVIDGTFAAEPFPPLDATLLDPAT
ncbi:hypothetical protein H8E07_17125, partial [bacterium]|nr:hypothetical protein [bacterium]